MKFDDLPSRPIIPSHLVAEKELVHWMQVNNLHEIRDCDGIIWHLKFHLLEKPDPGNKHTYYYELSFQVATRVKAQQLIRVGVLDPQSDERLIKILGDQIISMQMRPLSYKEVDIEMARERLVDTVQNIKSQLAQNNLTAIKRRLCEQFVDQSGIFGWRILKKNREPQ